MKRALMIAVLIPIIFATYILYVYFQPPPDLTERGDPPEFLITLVDNGENDYIDVKYIKTGTGFFNTGDPMSLWGMVIVLKPMENLYKYFDIRFPQDRLFLGETMRVFTSANVLEKGKFYQVTILEYFGADNVKCE